MRAQLSHLKTLVGLLIFTSLAPATQCSAEDSYKPLPAEHAPKDPIECSWSTMQKDDYERCLARKRFYEEQTPAERRAQNVEAVKNRARVVDNTPGDLKRLHRKTHRR